MKKILFILMAAIVCCSVISCNEKPKQYKFVKVMNDGKEQVEELDAKNDTDALKQYIIRMEKILTTSIAKGEEPDFKVMFIVSPEGEVVFERLSEGRLNESTVNSNTQTLKHSNTQKLN